MWSRQYILRRNLRIPATRLFDGPFLRVEIQIGKFRLVFLTAARPNDDRL